MWRSVFLHEFIDDRIGNFQALPGRPTTPSFLLQASDALMPGVNAVAISPGAGFEHVLDSPLHSIVGVSARVRMIYPPNPQPRMFSVVRLGGAAELVFWPVSDPLPDGSGTLALARVWVGSGFRNLGNVVLPASRYVEFRFDWHASGPARILADGRLVAYHNAVAPGALLNFDRVAFGMGNVTPPSPQPLYHLARVFVRALARPDPLAHLSKLLPQTAATPDVNRCRLRIIGGLLQVVDKLRAFMGGMHASLSQPWTEHAGSGPFRPEAVEAHALATTAAAALVTMLRTGDFAAADGFLDPLGKFLRLLRDAQPQAFTALAAEIEAMEVVPEACRTAFEASEEEMRAFAPIIELLEGAEALVRAIAGGTDVADLQGLRAFAAEHDFGLTAPLTHAQVRRLAQYWLPQMRFYWDERFHPVTLDDMFDMVEGPFAALPPEAQESWRVGVRVREGTAAVGRSFDPPAVHVPDGTAIMQTGQGPVSVKVRRVLNDGAPGRPALRLPEVDGGAVVTHGASFGRANQFFGPLVTLAGTNTGAPGDPFLPRADEPDPENPGERRPRVTAMAAFMNLLDLLRYELLVAGTDDYPPDGLRHGFGIVGSLLRREVHDAPDFPADQQRAFLLGAIRKHEAGEQLPEPPAGWRLDRTAWNAVTRFAFLEYYFFYAYNDFERYQTAIFDNEHEGDDEGCCLVFDRAIINLAAAGGMPALIRAVPFAIITSVHEEYQDADLLRFVPPPVVGEGEPVPPARDVVDFTVYVAGGSHATYLTPGDHDLVDFQDTWSYVAENAPRLLILAPLVLVISIILAILEHFIDTEDFTSDDGLHGGPDDVVGEDPLKVASRVLTLPMSAGNHIYQPRHEDLLALRAYAGKWGGHDGIVDKSPPFAAKTGRYFRKLLDKL